MNTLEMLMKGALGKKVPAEFATENYDYEAALRDELRKIAGTRRQFERNKYDVFDLLSEAMDEVLPQKVISTVGMFAETRQVPQGTRLEFTITRGKQRGRQFVTRATESGYYETFRLDRDRIDLTPKAIGAAGIMDFERYLDGAENIADIYEVITDGIVDEIFRMIQECLLASWNATGRPAANKVAATNFDAVAMVKLCNTVAAYGAPVIYCSPQFAAEMVNAIVYNTETKISDTDMQEVRDRGYIGKFRGTPVVVLPQSFDDETNSKLTMNPSFAYVIPSGKEKLVKVGMEGESFFKEYDNRDNSTVLQAYKKVGVAMVGTPNYWGIYYNSGIDAQGWEDYNTKLIG